ncbi:MAG: hypothetical protein HYS21_00750 [Deltaproteobacteria bacterium]|nr:hypothetical protein [Deltaproteobacteria bacterium]
MIKKILLLAFAFLFIFIQNDLKAASIASEEAQIKTLIVRHFITLEQAYSQTVEHNGNAFQGRPSSEIFAELEENVSNKKGMMDRIKGIYPLKEQNEQNFNMRVKKYKYKNFDFKTINIDGDRAIVEVDVYSESVNTAGAGTSVSFKTDSNLNIIEKEVYEAPAHDFIIQGGSKYIYELERIGNKWQIISTIKSEFLPGFGP